MASGFAVEQAGSWWSVLWALVAAALAGSVTATSPAVEGSRRRDQVGAKITIKGTNLGSVTVVTWVVYPGQKDYAAKLTKTATTIVATAPVTYPGQVFTRADRA